MLSQLLQADQEDPSIDFANNAEKRDASVVVAVTSLTLVLVQGNNLGVSCVLQHSSLSPALAEDSLQGVQWGGLAVLDEVWRNTVTAWCLACGQTVNDLAELIHSWLHIELFHDWHALDCTHG